jgi:hypothetical protein
MKRMIVLVLILGLLPITNGYAQTGKGNTLFGASSQFSLLPFGEGIPATSLLGIGFSTIKHKGDNSEESNGDTKLTSFNLAPRFGYFVADNLALGADLILSTMKMKSSYEEYESNSTVSLMGFGPFVRYYFPAGNMFPFLEAGAMLGQLKFKWDGTYSDGYDEKTGISGFNIGAGIGLPLGEKVLLDMALGYQSMSFKEKEDNEDNYRTVIGTLGLKVGIVVFLGGN